MEWRNEEVEEPCIKICEQIDMQLQSFSEDKPGLPFQFAIRSISYEKSYMLVETEIYTLTINNCADQIQQIRTNFDIQWLDDSIRNKYPGIGLPVYAIAEKGIEEKKIVVQQYLNYIGRHHKLRQSPEIKAFTSEKITFLEFKRQSLKESKTSTQQGLQQFIKGIIISEDPKFESSELNSLWNYKTQISEYILVINKILEFLFKKSTIAQRLIKNQTQILKKQNMIDQLELQAEQIRKSFIQHSEAQIKTSQQHYYQYQLYLRVVNQNLNKYLQIYNTITQLHQSIQALELNVGKYNELVNQQRILRLITNNMTKDIQNWLEYNNQLLLNRL